MLPIRDNIPTRGFPVITVVLIVINVAMFFGFQHAHWSGNGFAVSEKNTVEYAFIPYELTHQGKECDLVSGDKVACEGQAGVSGDASDQPSVWLTVLFAMFMHGGLLHIGGNMLFLWIFGNNVEDSMGPVRFVLFYLAGGVAADALQIAFDTGSATPTLGASGAVAAVLGGYILLYPRARVLTVIFIVIFFTIIELPAMLVLGLWFLEQLLFSAAEFGSAGEGGGGVAYFAHIGGFVFGLLTIRLLATHVKDTARRRPRDVFGR